MKMCQYHHQIHLQANTFRLFYLWKCRMQCDFLKWQQSLQETQTVTQNANQLGLKCAIKKTQWFQFPNSLSDSNSFVRFHSSSFSSFHTMIKFIFLYRKLLHFFSFLIFLCQGWNPKSFHDEWSSTELEEKKKIQAYFFTNFLIIRIIMVTRNGIKKF